MQPTAPTRFYRGSDRIAGGVCSGLAAGLHIDVLWVRIAFVLLAFVQGVGVLLYIVLLVVMPENPETKARGSEWLSSTAANVARTGGRFWRWVEGKPAQPAGAKTPDATSQPVGQARSPQLVLGVIVLAVGLLLLANNTGLINWSVIWPVFLIAIGVILLLRSAERSR
jgi:phage shock protein PspC (stress-responsive transcriptional regulator)